VESLLRRRPGGDGVIDAYLAELRRALGRPFLLRRRPLAEAEAHLRDSAEALRRSGLSAEDAERAAVARFGPAKAVAADVVRTAWPRSLIAPVLLLLGTLLVYVLPLYAIPENTLPAAPWPERPGFLTWKLNASLVAYGAALTAAFLAGVGAWRGWARVGPAAFVASLAAFGISATLGAVLTVQWTQAVPGSGQTLVLSLAATAITIAIAVAGAALAALQVPARRA
jgi:hypothetical protein